MITPSVKLAISAGMAPFSTCSGPIPRFQNIEEGRCSSVHTLLLKRLPHLQDASIQFGNIKAELVRGLGDLLAWPLCFINGENLRRVCNNTFSKFME